MFQSILKNSQEIVEYITSISDNSVDEDLIFEYFRDCKGILKQMNVKTLQLENPIMCIISEKKLAKYEKLPIKNMPPLIVENRIVLDGHHRFHILKKKKHFRVMGYDIICL
jgi:hypothetical protein